MAQASLDPDNPFWRFSCAVYARPEVAAACLDLQDAQGADVNLLLLAMWLGAARGVRLQPADIATLPGSEWQATVIAPLRALRRRLKAAPDAADPSVTAFRRQIFDCELAAERIRQAELFRWCEARFPARAGMAGLARANLAMLIREAPGVATALDLLACAAEGQAAQHPPA